jgi:hypothetical protein
VDKIEYTVTDRHHANAKCRGALTDLILDAHLIPRCGLIPPSRVLAAVLRKGGGNGGMSSGCIWTPFELSEDDYWAAVERLERFMPDDLTSRHRDPQITGEIRQDDTAPDTDDYGAWLKSLAHRGLVPY